MPNMISQRTFRLETTTGHVIHFEAKSPSWVAPEAVEDAMKAGCVHVDANDASFHDDLSRAKSDVTGDLRRSVLFLAVSAIAKRNNAKDFTGAGIPKVAAVEEAVGFECNANEIRDVYQQYQTHATGNGDFVLHPQSQNLMRVIEASTKDELLELALEFGVDFEKAEGLVSRDLRRLLMAKFAGVAVV